MIPARRRRDRQIFVSLRPAWSTYQVPGYPRLHKGEGEEREGAGAEAAEEDDDDFPMASLKDCIIYSTQ